jgi:hypothetical protein
MHSDKLYNNRSHNQLNHLIVIIIDLFIVHIPQE